MSRALSIAAGTTLAAVLGAAGMAAGCELPAGDMRLSSARYEAVVKHVPDPIVTGRHFALDIAICPKPGARAPESLRVDASMPEHRHGMNYKPSIKEQQGGRYRAEGLIFHMAGRWELVLEVRAAGSTERLSRSITMQ